MDAHFRQPSEMDFSSDGNIAERWKKWRQTMQLYIDVEMSEATEKDKCRAVLYIIGQDGRDIYNTMNFTGDDQDKIEPLLAAFEKYCIPRKNVTMGRYRFNTRMQGKTESIDQFVTDLRNMSKNCAFGGITEELIRDRIVCGTNSERVKERLLRDDELTLTKAITVCRADEESKRQIKTLSEEDSVHALRRKSGKVQHKQQRKEQEKFSCGKCGNRHEKRNCPAYGKKCRKCGKLNHFQKCCKSKQRIHGLEENDESDCESDCFVGSITEKRKTEIQGNECFTTYKVQGRKIKFKVDTGSQANILPKTIYDKLSNVKIKPTKTTLTSYSGDKLKVRGKCQLKLQDKQLEFFVTDTEQSPLLGFKASKELGLIQVVMTVQPEDPIKAYPIVFNGLGCLDKPYRIEIDRNVKPVINPPRNIPTALREKLKTTLKEMEDKKVIRKVDEPTDWVNSLVVVKKPKSDKLRVCLDPRNLNKAIKREHFQLPTIEDITTRMSGAKYFSKLDANQGYWQVRLDDESQLLTTFNSPFGRYCFMRMPFGINSAQEVYQKRISQIFENLDGVETDIDDIIIWGRTPEEHDRRLETVLRKCEEVGLTLNPEKCKFRMTEVTYIGHVLGQDGVRPDPEKVKAITNMPAPTDKKGVQRLLGTVNYIAKFVPNMSAITEPIRQLLKDDVQFVWTYEQKKAFEQIKSVLTKDPILKYFDVRKQVTVSCDASKSGLGAVLLQDDQPVAFASRSMTETETRYANIEKELLAILFGLERFHQYTYGKHVNLQSDHKPLEAIVKKPLANTPPRLQRMLLRLQRYDFSVNYTPGRLLTVPDMLSRAYIQSDEINDSDEIECFINMIVENMPVSDRKMNEIKKETEKDEILSSVKKQIRTGWPESRSEIPMKISEYWNCRHELSESKGLLLKGEKIVIPTSLRNEMLKRLHESHLGIEKTKKLARDFIYWPGLNGQISDMISKCGICQEHRNSKQKEPMIPSEVPELPWHTVGSDLFYWNGKDYLLIVDYYSRYFEVAKLENISAKTVIIHFKSIFARHGVPTIVRSDSGSQYTSSEFKNFSKSWGFEHLTSSPYHQQSNGLAEKYVNVVKKLLQKAKDDGKDPYVSLMDYRNTPINDVNSPAQLLMNRRLRGGNLPATKKQLVPKVPNIKQTREKLQNNKLTQKRYYDRNSKHESKFERGQAVRYQNQKQQWRPAVIVDQHESPRSYNIRTSDGSTLRRNSKHIIKTEENFKPTVIDDDDDDELFESMDNTQPCETNIESPFKTRSGRTVKKPARFKDYV